MTRTVSGLENPLYAVLVAAIAAVISRAIAFDRLLSRRTASLSGALAAGAALTRPDGLVYAGAFVLVALVFLRGDSVRQSAAACFVSVAAVVVPYGAYVAYRWTTFRRLVPHTAVAKDQGAPGLADLAEVSELIGYVGWVSVLLFTGLVAATIIRRRSFGGAFAGLLVPLGLAMFALCVLQWDWMGQYRFATPVWTLGALLVGVTLTTV